MQKKIGEKTNVVIKKSCGNTRNTINFFPVETEIDLR